MTPPNQAHMARQRHEPLSTPIRIIRPSDSASRPTRDSLNPGASSGVPPAGARHQIGTLSTPVET